MEDFYSQMAEQKRELDISTVMQKVFLMMTLGFVVTALTSLITVNVPRILYFVINFWQPLLLAEFLLVIILSYNIKNMGTATCNIAFYLYAILNGLTLSIIFFAYTESSIASTFFIAATMFGLAALYGKKTNKDLTKFGTFFMMGLIGLLLAGVINLFLMNSMVDFVATVVGIVLFIGVTAYDVQKIKEISTVVGDGDEEKMTQVVTMGALSLYLDFINIFLKLLALSGKRRK